jgi:mono/diheme cytochrome c family protein
MLRFLDRGLIAASVAGVVLLVVLLIAGPDVIGAEKKTSQGSAPQAASGSQIFTSSGCGGCHSLKAAGTNGSIGPDLDKLRPDAAAVAAIVRSGGGSMPSFASKLSAAQISELARYVSSVSGG